MVGNLSRCHRSHDAIASFLLMDPRTSQAKREPKKRACEASILQRQPAYIVFAKLRAGGKEARKLAGVNSLFEPRLQSGTRTRFGGLAQRLLLCTDRISVAGDAGCVGPAANECRPQCHVIHEDPSVAFVAEQ